MIVLCPKTLGGKENSLQREFLWFYLSKEAEEAIVSNEIWEAFRLRIKKKWVSSPLTAEKIINHVRGFARPENTILKGYEEEEPKRDYSDKELMNATKNLVERNWANVNFFIVETEEEIKKYKFRQNINIKSLPGFYVNCMNSERGRRLIEEFTNKIRWDEN